MKNVRFLILAVFAAAILGACTPAGLRGSAIEPATAAVDFELSDTTGTAFKLSDHKGDVVLLFFGYANCPDFCPTTLAEYKNIHEQLGESAAEVRFVFVTVDPDRDSPEAIDQFVHAFNPSFIGLTGTEEQLQFVWENYFVGRIPQVVEDSEMGYLVSHATRIYVVDKAGNLRLTFPFGMPVADMTHDINLLLAE
jgi:protein SCO1/2